MAVSSGPIIAQPHAASPYTMTAGTVIYGTLETGINSDLPGDVLALVAQDVKDSVTERHVLIPQGSKLIGAYSNQLVPSQQRLMVKWRRIVFPNGGELNLPDLTGSDAAGYTGFQDQVDHHYARVWPPALLMSAISAGMMMSDYPMMSTGSSGCGYSMGPGQMAAMGAGQQLGHQAMGHMATVQESHPRFRSDPAITSVCWLLATLCSRAPMRKPPTPMETHSNDQTLDTPLRSRPDRRRTSRGRMHYWRQIAVHAWVRAQHYDERAGGHLPTSWWSSRTPSARIPEATSRFGGFGS